ncbi:short chain dehydrogenase [Diplodia corticola]|uniref:Short chain dehydrogenase n=1 Tax=Diplodia corticola TaxID=236234 RepID=A0A1J9RN05_9PEZI|nr:short chain dehydrogenase [Diplodia corticola]OJD28989.1 short chain dehydrogenase [Diplodia corticola]
MLSEITVDEAQFAALKGQVVLVTGAASGIGLATVKLLLSQGAIVVAGDLNEVPLPLNEQLSFQKTDTTSWADLLALFKKAKQQHGRIDHVFANAGISTRINYLEENLDANGDLLEPSHQVIDINLRGTINTATLALHYMKPERQQGGGSIVLTSSSTAFQRMRAADYAISKHGVLGILRGMLPNIESANLPVRLNIINPAWTDTGMVPASLVESVGGKTQPPEVVARSVALLMSDKSRNGQAIYSAVGQLFEIEEAVLQPAKKTIVGTDRLDEDTVFKLVLKQMGEKYQDKV